MKTRIAILGIGAVGGYFGGLLAKRYKDSPDVEIIFIARGENEETIKKNGLKIITPTEEFSCVPNLVTNDPEQIGKIDVLIIAVKSYHLEESLVSLKNALLLKRFSCHY